jgi:hypothetical protein
MLYLGGVRGAGTLKSGTEEPGVRADFDLDCFRGRHGEVTGCGEIRTSPAALKEMFGRKDLRLLTDDGRCLNLAFSEKQLLAATSVAHVDVTGGLADAFDGHAGTLPRPAKTPCQKFPFRSNSSA